MAAAKPATSSKGTSTQKSGLSPAAAAAPDTPIKRDTITIEMKDIKPMLWEQADNEVIRSNKLPLLIDPTGRAMVFLRYGGDMCIKDVLDGPSMQPESLRLALLNCIRHGKALVLNMEEADLTNTIKA